MCILIVEDEPAVMLLLSESLMEEGHEVVCAEHGARAIGLLQWHPKMFSALITDFTMPYGVTGADVVEHMRRDYPEVPMLLTTALPSSVSQAWCAEHRVQVLAKPYKLEDVVGPLAHLLPAV